jgi:hypothetical protein
MILALAILLLLVGLIVTTNSPMLVDTVAVEPTVVTPMVEILPSFTPPPPTVTLIPTQATATNTITPIPPSPTRTPIPPTPNVVVCFGAPTSHLANGWQGTVTTAGLRLRETPGTNGRVVMRDLAVGTIFTVMGDAICEDGYAWWNIVLSNGVYGWAAEGTNSPFETYYLVPKY